jgi:hypothetical protein
MYVRMYISELIKMLSKMFQNILNSAWLSLAEGPYTVHHCKKTEAVPREG